MAATAPLRTTGQNARIWALAAQLPLSRADREGIIRELCRAVSGQDHSSRLTVVQAATVITSLEARVSAASKPIAPPPPLAASRKPWGSRGPGRRSEQPIQPQQQLLITELFIQAGMEEAERQRAFTARQCKVPWAQTQAHADALIEALSAMILRPVPPDVAQARIRAILGHARFGQVHSKLREIIIDLSRQYATAKDPAKVLSTHKLRKICEAEEALCMRT